MTDDQKEYLKKKANDLKAPVVETEHEVVSFLKWMLLALAAGLVIGAFSSVFALCMQRATEERQEHTWLLYLLPYAGLLIVYLYRKLGLEKDQGTNTVLGSLRAHGDIPFWMAPLIFLSTVLTHLCGGSAGREGAALQIGGSLGNFFGRLLHLNEADRKVLIMCGMSAAFSALFGTPMAAAMFSLEVVTVGIMYYSALLPCAVASLTAHYFSTSMAGIKPEAFHISEVPEGGLRVILVVIALSVICAFTATFFCWLLHRTGDLSIRLFRNPYIRIAAAGLLIIGLTVLEGSGDYNGAGIPVIERAFEGDVAPWAFLLKMIFTALTLGAGFRGGEIVPSFFVGATLGATLGMAFGLPASLSAGLGMAALFCGVTNCPVSTLFICFELFHYKGIPYFLLAISISYVLSGYSGLYHGQQIMYSKYSHFEGKEKQ